MILGFDCCVPVQICEFFFFFELIVCLGDLIGRPDVYTQLLIVYLCFIEWMKHELMIVCVCVELIMLLEFLQHYANFCLMFCIFILTMEHGLLLLTVFFFLAMNVGC